MIGDILEGPSALVFIYRIILQARGGKMYPHFGLIKSFGNSHDVCITLLMYLMPLNCILKKSQDGKLYITCILS